MQSLTLEKQFQQALQDKLPTGYHLRMGVISRLRQRLPQGAGEALDGAKICFLKPDDRPVFVSVIYLENPARITHADQWDNLQAFCQITHELTGIRVFVFQGIDQTIRVFRSNVRGWIRESVK